MGLLELLLLDKIDKTLYIGYIVFSKLFLICIVLFISSKKIIVKLVNYHFYLINYQDYKFIFYFQF